MLSKIFGMLAISSNTSSIVTDLRMTLDVVMEKLIDLATFTRSLTWSTKFYLAPT
ncbi:hypothetical protein KFK09_026526 [Dendrobium nobile]|uniref:Uncharacterized protein n=1 Tax=Dendrobium nobile TaxID=94219 RepID=A0A8T3A727_DENNO|nr:hypothetical protein KFK09_026526 [Dendrobium nobile]